MTISALRSSSVRRALSDAAFDFLPATGSRLDFGPRFWGAKAWRMPAARSRRQVVNRDEYNPSRRSSAPMPPEPLAWSASARMRCLYSAVKRPALGLGHDFGVGVGGRGRHCLPWHSGHPRYARAPSAPPAAMPQAEAAETLWLFIVEILSRPAL